MGQLAIGGLAGSGYGTIITKSYFLSPADGGGPDNGYGKPLSDLQMRQKSSFVGWDFVGVTDGVEDIWAMPFAGGYPLFTYQVYELPVNNEPAGAIAIDVGQVMNGNTDNAFGQDRTVHGLDDYKDVWYYFVPAQSARYTISTCGSEFDTTLAVFANQGLKEAAYNEDYCGEQSKVVLKATAGKKYYIRIAGYDGASGSYNLSIIKDSPEPLQSDVNYDGTVDMGDFRIMASEWLDDSQN